MVQLLEVLMRKYTGIFSYPVPIDEDYIAGVLEVQVPMLRQLLYKLSLEHVIRYIPCDHATVLFLHHERLRPKNVNLDPEKYEMLKNSALERMQKMIDYIREEDICRSTYLLEYFGQKESTDCGTCDVCRSATKLSSKQVATASEETAAQLIAFINYEMSGHYTLDDVKSRFALSEVDMSVLRCLIDSGTVPSPQI
jgi:ATP-dependent DNA helicase RecQ